MDKSRLPIIVGLSVNPEEINIFSSEPEEEKVIGEKRFTVLSGSGANIAQALDTYFQASGVTLLGLTGLHLSDVDVQLQTALTKVGLVFKRISVLTQTSSATVVCNTNPKILVPSLVIGYPGSIVEDAIPNAVFEIQQTVNNGTSWIVLTGVKPDQYLLAKAFLGENNIGFRSFCPHKLFIKDKSCRDNLIELIKTVDCLIMNEKEFLLLGMDTKELHDMGVSIVVVTNGDKGGFFSLLTQHHHFFAEQQKGQIFGTGAGDWFHAMLVYFHRELNVSYRDVNFEQLISIVQKASMVAGKKVLYPGGAVGPSKEDFNF